MNKSGRYLLFLMLFLAGSSLFWYYLGHKPLYWDSADHLSYSLDSYKALSNSNTFSDLLTNLLDVSWYYPPLVYWASIPFHAIFGQNDFAGFLEMTFFLLLLVYSVYQIGKRIYNEEAGVFAAFCISMFPIVSEYTRDYMLDLPLAAMIAAAVYSLIRTNDFSSRAGSIRFGVMLGLGMLTKWTVILFLIVPVIYYLKECFVLTAKKSRIIVNFLLSVIIALIVSLPWYLRNIVQILTNRLNELERGNLSLTENIFYYLKIIPGQISLLLTILFIVSIFLFFKNSFFLKKRLLLYWLIGSYVLITIINFKLPRFSIALLIPLSILFSGMLFYGENEPKKRNLFVKIFTAAAVLNFIFFSFLNPGINFALPVIDTQVVTNITPDKTNWKNAEVIKVISDDMKSRGKQKANLRLLSEEENFNSSTLRYYAKLVNAPINILGADGFPFFSDYTIEIKKEIKDSNGVQTNPGSLLENKYARTFEEIKKFDLKNGEQILLFKIRQKIAEDISIDSLKEKIEKSAEKFFGKYIIPPQKIVCKIISGDSISLSNGKIKSLKISCDSGLASTKLFRGFQYINSADSNPLPSVMPFNKFEFVLNGLEYNIQSLMDSDKFQILSLNEYKITSLEITNENLETYLLKKTAQPTVKINQNIIEIKNGDKFNEITLLISESNSLPEFKITHSELFGIPLPYFITNYMFSKYNPIFKGTDAVPVFKTGKLVFSQNKMSIKE
ncbi:MAG: glycosyltransferase family 39 protein [Bacteroidetes bacterium]|nr:glycosyltransferase family 39 protein [Bacteroidota bacterium]